MDVEDILAKQVEQLEREKRELQEKLKSQEKKVSFPKVIQLSLPFTTPLMRGHLCLRDTLS